jgi:hypothetical protein
MYIFLLLLGSLLVLYGTRLRKEDKEDLLVEEQVPDKIDNIKPQIDEDIRERLQALENLVYGLEGEEDFLEEGEEPEAEEAGQERSFQEVLETTLQKSPERPEVKADDYDLTEERRRLFEGLDKGQYSMDMVCSILGMEKGEVLLLRNIYNKYQK